MDELPLHPLRLFCAVARLGSFTKASRELYISQPAVSAQVRHLEQAIGAPLLERVGRSVRLTQAGEVVYEHGRQIFALQEALVRNVQDLLSLQTGRLILASSTTPGDYLLPGLIGQFKARHPKIDVELRIANTPVIVRQLVQREVDLGFVGDSVEHEELTALPFRPDDIVAFVRPDHAYARRKAVRTLGLAGQAFVLREPGSATRKWAEESLRALGIRYSVAMELGSNEAVKRAVLAGLGIGMLSRYALETELAMGVLRVLPVRGLRSRRWLYLVHNRRSRLTSVQQAFIELAQEQAGG